MSERRLSEPATGWRGGPQIIPRPGGWYPGEPAFWHAPGYSSIERITVDDVRSALAQRGAPDVFDSTVGLRYVQPEASRRPSAVLCALFEEDGQAQVVLTRRSAALKAHTHQVSFPGGRIEEGETPLQAALREAWEEVRLDTSRIEIIGELTGLQTAMNPARISPFVGVLPGRPNLVPNPAEVERAFTTPLIEFVQPDVYREEIWPFPDGVGDRPVHFFELDGDTVWGATARMLTELLTLVLPPAADARAAG